MLDPNLLRNEPETVAAALARRHFKLDVSALTALDQQRKSLQIQMEEQRNARNEASREIAQARRQGLDTTAMQNAAGQYGETIKALEQSLEIVLQQWEALVSSLPNIPQSSVPDGHDEADNVLVRHWGTPREFSFTPKDHVDLGEALGILDFAAGVRLAGARFVVLRGLGARLERALTQFMLDLHVTAHAYTEIAPPFLANSESLFGTGQLPKFEEDLFALRDDPYYLIPTAEVPLTNLLRGDIVSTLPQKFCAYTPCFRREAGAYGRDTRGMIRQHQFDKVELVQVVRPQDSATALEELTGHAEKILQLLELPYRVMALCAGDMGFSAARTYDLEVWLPGQSQYREISSCSNFESFQARRLQLRYRGEDGKPQLVHTLNGSGLAIGRTLVALLENHQQADGSVHIPEVLRPYLGGMEILRA
ncbi:serine--tRNA ligase [Acidithiobacillus thiooxidans]|uniref:Serine--tRNA ligase n=1 Tax=Acidithiobacillus thiooxidans TaxID=930 RepID=A0A1C2IAK2_ACITH|nr:serine--tRNA ligase [Acidithiobacillus thiooxidans]OCX70833.1 serine--tRNA ligase [Acidithiobacillus thiooxidans]OCX73036.1 serine--tRNA ligase [Acidithiobacillus thiooxidans]OCX77889.1 serine--tRNA ligase [Acidithiobacillus thiooxidans]OCX80540.1 serine--tRNA ligase [Acidithiobacillus thiooxidans]OCX84037.1 serine--tRNA ligase [Acidithiobacillus thiooxidans]